MTKSALAALLIVAVFADSSLLAQKRRKKKDQELPTQVRQLPKDLPQATVADADHLLFHTAPLSSRGLLSQQVRDALKALDRLKGGATLIKLRAFVAGTGDMRRVQQIVSETYTDRHQPLPALSVIQVGGLPMEGAQLALESISADRKAANPGGVAFLAGQQIVAESPTARMQPLAAKSVAQLGTTLAAAGANKDDLVRITCFLTSLEDVGAVRETVAREFPRAPAVFVQLQREPRASLVECEAVARLVTAPASSPRLLNPPPLAVSPNYSQAALVGPIKLAFTGSQMAFGYQSADARLAFQRLEKALGSVNSSLREAVWTSCYPLSAPTAQMIRTVRFDFLNKAAPPAATMVPFEGLPSLDASFAVDAIARVTE
jgi:enamine deaminase RidA (YjgF/YER057c/UK114 family)